MREQSNWPPYLGAIVLSLLVAGPWLVPGYLFGTDWPGPRHFIIPADFSSGTVFDAVLVLVSAMVSSEVTTKFLILIALLGGALGAFRALPVGGFFPRAMASLIYVVNPFVYGRIHYGQLALIAAYALLPWIAVQILRLMREPGWRGGLIIATELTALGILDLHLLIPAGLLLLGAVCAFGISHRGDRRYLTELAKSVGLAMAVTTVSSSYWLIPLLSGSNSEGRTVAGVGAGDLAVYSVVSDQHLGLVPNLLGLYGFWAEDTHRFSSMKAFAPLWPLVLTLLLLVGALGVWGVVRKAPTLPSPAGGGTFLRLWVFALLGVGAVALILEMGVASPVMEPLVRFLDTVFPPYRGMRDAGKWGALIALVYAQLIPLGAIVVLRFVEGDSPPPRPSPARGEGENRGPTPARGEGVKGLAAGLLLALPLYYGNGLLFGSHSEIQPSAYPSGWYKADQVLAADPRPGRALFLPWHLYLALGFVRNTNNVVASPASSFFSVPTLVSADPENDLPPPSNPDQNVVSRLVAAGAAADWARELAGRNIKYVLLAREVDWTSFRFLATQPGFALVGDYGSIAVYRNLDWSG